jgi:hypothetical protein
MLDGVCMNDPHVAALIYRVTHSEGFTFDAARPLEFETLQFAVRVENGTARFVLKEHYAHPKEARAAVEPFIRVWEAWEALGPVLSGFRLVYQKPEVVDRTPPEGNYADAVLPTFRASARGAGYGEVMSLGSYPDPPTERAAMNTDVEVMAYRYWLYRQGRDTLAAMAYFCLTMLEISAGGRKQAAKLYNVSARVLSKIGILTDSKGGRSARKGKGVAQEFTPSEQSWLEGTIRALIHRAADIASDPNQALPPITDLPSA